jgi:iron complex transport system ATP-binding protein
MPKTQAQDGHAINLENLIAFRPQCAFVYASFDKSEMQQLENAGIKVIAVRGETLEESFDAVRLIAQVLDCEAKGEEYVRECKRLLALVQDRIKDILPEERPRVIFAGPKSVYTIATGEMLQNQMLELAGAVNTGDSLKGFWSDVSPEQVAAWNPDVIFIGSSLATYGIQDVLRNSQFKSVKAVRNGKVYIFPSNIGWWDYPAPQCVLVERGNICGLMGRNGSGKTTMLRCINAILRPMRGRVIAHGREVDILSRVEIARLISLVPQGLQTAFSFTCLEMILMGSAARTRAWSAPGKRETQKALEILEEVGIHALAPRPFNHLSGGERQLVMLSRALFQDAPIMLLDEPNSHLDFSNQHRMMGLMRKMVKKRGVTALISLHDPNLTLYYCDQVAMLKEGRIVAHGPTGDVMEDRMLQQVLGENIQTDLTVKGLQVVTPKMPMVRG